MIHPSYVELMQVVNNDSTVIGEEPVVNSRYSIVIAAAKRARQIIGGDEPMIAGASGRKPLSVAVQELYEGKVKIISEDDDSGKKRYQERKQMEDLANGPGESIDEEQDESLDKSVDGDLPVEKLNADLPDGELEDLDEGLEEKLDERAAAGPEEEHYEAE